MNGSTTGRASAPPPRAAGVWFDTFSRYVAGRVAAEGESLARGASLDPGSPRYIITERGAGRRVPAPLEREP